MAACRACISASRRAGSPRSSGSAGWVRNLPDGGVEAVFEGSADKVAHAVAWARNGPPSAVVTSLVESAEEPRRAHWVRDPLLSTLTCANALSFARATWWFVG